MDQLLAARIDDFLREHRECEPGGGWAEVTDDDLNKLDVIIDRLVELKCDRDADGDIPVAWTLVNRRKRHRSPYVAVPLSMDIRSLQDPLLEDLHGAVSLNLALANEENSRFTRLLQDLFRAKRRKGS